MNRERKKSWSAARWFRISIYVTFTAVLLVRYVFHRESSQPTRRPQLVAGGQRGDVVFGQPGVGRNFGPRVNVHPPTSEVPADLWRIQIEISNGDAERLQEHSQYGFRGARSQERPEVRATIREGGTVYTNVALHLKGAAGSFQPFDSKPSLTLSFSKYAPGQKFHGYTKISLNNSVQDASFLCEAISREMFEAAGVPVPRAGHATVLINGRDLGLYVFTEGFGKPFLKRYFKNVSGNLFDCGFCQDVTRDLDTNSGDHPGDRSGLDRLAAAAAAVKANRVNAWQSLNDVLDMDRFITFLAMEAMTCHWDGYSMNRNNYRVFHNLETDRMVFIPHGLDQMFGARRAGPDMSLDPRDPRRRSREGIVAHAVLSTPEGYRLYWEKIASLRTNVFREKELVDRVQELAGRIRPTLAAYSQADQFDDHVRNLCQRITMRAESISAQINVPKKPIEPTEPIHPSEPANFDGRGAAKLSGWTPRMNMPLAGSARFDKTDEGGRLLLHITATQGRAVGSWRKRVSLNPGRYRFEGRARTRGVPNGGGVGLFISGSEPDLQRIEGQGWVSLRFPMRVNEGEATTEVELVCELRAIRGEAWFDADSLRIVRE